MTSAQASAIFPGTVVHVRRRPVVHKLSYKIYSLLLDLDELESLHRKLWWFSLDRFNLFSFYRRDRGDGSGRDLRGQVEAAMAAGGIVPDGGPIRLLTMPRVLGWGFNPLSIFFCYDRSGSVNAILWEVDNTFGERHGYLIPTDESDFGTIQQTCAKRLYVSPFMDMNLRYVFKVRPPAERLAIGIDVSDDAGLLFIARHVADRVELTDTALLRAFVSLPLLTLRVVGGIHWEAVKIWLKGVHLRARPPPPEVPVSIIAPICPQRKHLPS
ncbi:MAG: DUF1365 family protein [Hyphomicrobiaceae bacterium]